MSRTLAPRYQTGIFHALFVLMCISIAVYFRLDFYPDTYYSDEEIPIAVVKYIETHHSLDTNWKQGVWRNPGDQWAFGYDQYNFSSYNSTLYYLHQLFNVSKNNINPAVFNRITSVVFQIVTLVLIFYSLNYLIGIYGAICASLFFVVNPLLVVDAHYARPESFLILIVTLAIFCHLFAATLKKNNLFLLSAFFWGIACACKFSILPMAALSVIFIFIKQKKLAATLWALIFLIGAFVLAPYMFIHVDKVWDGILALFKQYFNATSVNTLSFQRSDWLLPKYLLGYFGVAFWLAIFLSLLSKDKLQKCLAKFLFAISTFYIFVFSLLSFFNESNLSHLAFVWCLLLAIATEVFVTHIKQKTNHIKTVYTIFVITIIATPALCSIKIRNAVYNSTATVQLQESINIFEHKLLDKYPGSNIVDITKHLDMIGKTNTPSLIAKVSWINRNEYDALGQLLLEKHYVLVDELRLPLSDLPHSQLQSIHFPASYRYYQLRP